MYLVRETQRPPGLVSHPNSSPSVPSLEQTVPKSQSSFQREALHLLHTCVCARVPVNTHTSEHTCLAQNSVTWRLLCISVCESASLKQLRSVDVEGFISCPG